MSAPRYPEAAEVRSAMQRIKIAMSDLDTLMKAQIGQAIFQKPIEDRHRVMLAVWATLGSLEEAITLYRVLLVLDPDEAPDPIVEEA